MSAATVQSAGVRRSVRARRALRWRPGERLGYAMVAPVLLALLAITAYPLVVNLLDSFRSYNLLYPTAGNPYLGLRNYRNVFNGVGLDTTLGTALEHTIIYAAISVAVEITLGLAIALLLDRPIRGRGIARTMILLPWAVPTVVAAIVWKTLLDQQTGGVDYILGNLGLGHPAWTGASTLAAWTAILIADCWQTVPFVAIILLAGLQGIPRDLYEAAAVDGASRLQVFRGITLPMLRPALLVVLVFRTLSAFLIFDIIYAMTQGGPGTATETVAFQDFGAIITNLDFGLGGAISVVMVIVALLIAWLYRLTLKPTT